MTKYEGGTKLTYKGKEIVSIEQHTKCKCDCKVKASVSMNFKYDHPSYVKLIGNSF